MMTLSKMIVMLAMLGFVFEPALGARQFFNINDPAPEPEPEPEAPPPEDLDEPVLLEPVQEYDPDTETPEEIESGYFYGECKISDEDRTRPHENNSTLFPSCSQEENEQILLLIDGCSADCVRKTLTDFEEAYEEKTTSGSTVFGTTEDPFRRKNKNLRHRGLKKKQVSSSKEAQAHRNLITCDNCYRHFCGGNPNAPGCYATCHLMHNCNRRNLKEDPIVRDMAKLRNLIIDTSSSVVEAVSVEEHLTSNFTERMKDPDDAVCGGGIVGLTPSCKLMFSRLECMAAPEVYEYEKVELSP